MHLFRALLPLLSAFMATASNLIVHDESFVPDAILRVTSGVRKQSCVPEKEILLVNGTSPGPELRFTEGRTVWIRVYNDVHGKNLTIVGLLDAFLPCHLSSGNRSKPMSSTDTNSIALAWPDHGSRAIL